MQLISIKTVDTQPASLLHVAGKAVLITKASRGSNTAASVNFIVRASMDCKNWLNVIVWL